MDTREPPGPREAVVLALEGRAGSCAHIRHSEARPRPTEEAGARRSGKQRSGVGFKAEGGGRGRECGDQWLLLAEGKGWAMGFA